MCIDVCVFMCVHVFVLMCVCVHVCVRKRTFHVCVFQEKRITRITLMYQVDVCVDGCVLMGVC